MRIRLSTFAQVSYIFPFIDGTFGIVMLRFDVTQFSIVKPL